MRLRLQIRICHVSFSTPSTLPLSATSVQYHSAGCGEHSQPHHKTQRLNIAIQCIDAHKVHGPQTRPGFAGLHSVIVSEGQRSWYCSASSKNMVRSESVRSDCSHAGRLATLKILAADCSAVHELVSCASTRQVSFRLRLAHRQSSSFTMLHF